MQAAMLFLLLPAALLLQKHAAATLPKAVSFAAVMFCMPCHVQIGDMVAVVAGREKQVM